MSLVINNSLEGLLQAKEADFSKRFVQVTNNHFVKNKTNKDNIRLLKSILDLFNLQPTNREIYSAICSVKDYKFSDLKKTLKSFSITVNATNKAVSKLTDRDFPLIAKLGNKNTLITRQNNGNYFDKINEVEITKSELNKAQFFTVAKHALDSKSTQQESFYSYTLTILKSAIFLALIFLLSYVIEQANLGVSITGKNIIFGTIFFVISTYLLHKYINRNSVLRQERLDLNNQVQNFESSLNDGVFESEQVTTSSVQNSNNNMLEFIILHLGLAFVFYQSILILLIAYVFLAYIYRKEISQLENSILQYNKLATKLQNITTDYTAKIDDIKMSSIYGNISNKIRTISAEYYYLKFKIKRDQILTEVSIELVKLIAIVVVLCSCVYLADSVNVGQIFATAIITYFAFDLFANILKTPSYSSTESAPEKEQKLRSFDLVGDIEFADASYHEILQNIDLTIKRGSIVAISGANGAGKSSITKMVSGIFAATSGKVLINGLNVQQLDSMVLRSKIAFVPQHSKFVQGSIKDNFLAVDPLLSESAIFKALETAGAQDDVKSLEQGIDTDMDKVMFPILREKISLARAYAMQPDIYVFDEAAHSLGADTDRNFQQFIETIRGQKTCFIVTHREDQRQLADNIIEIDSGRIASFKTQAKI